MQVTKSDFSNTLKITKFFAASMGVLIYNRGEPVSRRRYIANRIYFCFCCFAVSYGGAGGFVYMVPHLRINFMEATHILPCICYATIVMFSIVSMVLNLDKSEKLLYILEELWPVEGLEEVQAFMVISYTKMWTTVKSIFAYFNVFFILFFEFCPLLVMGWEFLATGSATRSLPFYVWFPFDTMGTYVYPFMFAFEVLISTYCLTGLVAADTFLVTVISNICTQLKLLNLKIQNLVEQMNPPEMHFSIEINERNHQEMYAALIECVKKHSELIKITDTIEEIFSLSILVNFLLSSIMICSVGFQFTTATGIDFYVFIIFFIWSLIQAFMLCLAGNHLIDTSNSIADAAYNSSWYLTDKKYRQLIHFIILRAQRPQTVTMFRFSVVSFASFSSMLRTSYSYFLFLQQAYNDK